MREGQGYCAACRAAYMRAYRAAGREQPMDDEARRRHNARKLVAMRVRRGTMQRQPCEGCGSPQVEAHHDDYAQPAAVRWLCRRCHRRHHRQAGTTPKRPQGVAARAQGATSAPGR